MKLQAGRSFAFLNFVTIISSSEIAIFQTEKYTQTTQKILFPYSGIISAQLK